MSTWVKYKESMIKYRGSEKEKKTKQRYSKSKKGQVLVEHTKEILRNKTKFKKVLKHMLKRFEMGAYRREDKFRLTFFN